ncbi:hypothetical protein ABZW30_40400 [Kitasatospora sp. NPDC004669]|uniref:hypothetical protein n=1 Tax=Kitasatospora sp. NPDC004669 TaxID=3154555 RepID=UPI0033A69FFA
MSQTRDAAVVEPDPDLSLAEIWAPISGNKNRLVQDDCGLDPKAVIALNEEREEVGDRISLYWGEGATVPEVEYELTVSDLSRQEAGFEVPWPSIKATGKGDIPVWYTITPDDTDTPARKSTRTLVTVEAVTAAVETD